MSENVVKLVQSASPVRAGAGDISERGLSRERSALRSTPPARLQPAHPKKLFSTPVSKFTCRRAPASGPQLARLRSCLDQYTLASPAGPARAAARAKAASMEDLTPTKRVKKERRDNDKESAAPPARVPCRLGGAEAQAAARIARFLAVAAWRRRRREAVELRLALDSKRSSCSRLRMQVCVLRALLEADGEKVARAARELQRLQQLLRDRDLQRVLLDQEKLALEKDVTAAEDRVSELSIGWHNSRNELEAARAELERVERERAEDCAATAEARAQRDRAYTRINLLEEELAQHAALLQAAERTALALRREDAERERALRRAAERLRAEQEARSRGTLEASALRSRCSLLGAEAGALRDQLAALRAELAAARDQLACWPRTLTRLMGAARSWLRRPMSLPEAVVWSLLPARHGCH